MTDPEACKVLTTIMSNAILSQILLRVKNLSFSQCGQSHEPREQVQGPRLASSSPAKGPDVTRRASTVLPENNTGEDDIGPEPHP